MAYLRWEHRPTLRRPVLLAAFEGWNDAAEAASTALRWFADSLEAQRFATVDPEDFYDFTVARPHVRLEGGLYRVVEWPTPTFEWAPLRGSERDVVFLHAIEPALKWRTYCEQVLSLCSELGVTEVYTLGALLADVPHTRPVRVMGTASDEKYLSQPGFRTSRYEGPTGILGVLHDACRVAGVPSASLWANTPHYLAQTPSPRAALALVERLGSLLGERLDTADLQIAAASYDRQVEREMEGEEELGDYVRHLEEESVGDVEEDETVALEIPTREDLAAEVERFLRDQRES